MSCSFRFTSRDSALRTSGRLSVTQTTPCFSSTTISAMPGNLSASQFLGAPARTRLLAEVRLEALRRQLVTDEGRHRTRCLAQLDEIDTGLHTHRVQHRDDIFRRDDTPRARCIRTTA